MSLEYRLELLLRKRFGFVSGASLPALIVISLTLGLGSQGPSDNNQAPSLGTSQTSTMSRSDSNDTDGSLDLKAIVQWRSDGLMRHTIRTYSSWENPLLSRRKDWVAIRISTSTQDVQCCSYVVWVRHSSSKGLFATIHRFDGSDIVRTGTARVRRGNKRSVLISLRPQDLELQQGDSYRWSGESSLETERGACSSDRRIDDAFPAPGTCWDQTRELRRTV